MILLDVEQLAVINPELLTEIDGATVIVEAGVVAEPEATDLVT